MTPLRQARQPSALEISQWALLLIAIVFCINTLVSYLQVSLWQHDSAYYDYDSLYVKIKYEGRWLLPWLVYPFQFVTGQVILLLDLAALFVFFYVVGVRATHHRIYALLFASLCISVPAHVYQLMWPTNTVPSILLLALSPLISQRLHPVWFYVVMGVLLFATASHYYYLLPLLHISTYTSLPFKDGLKKVCFNLIPAWGLGFIIGYIVSLLGVYAYTFFTEGVGQWGIEIRPWRRPNQAESLTDLMTNANRSFTYFTAHLDSVFLRSWAILVVVMALLIRLILDWKKSFLASFILATAMVVVHYVVVLPVGINIDLRTVVNVWLGLFLVLFLIRPIADYPRTMVAMMCLMVLLNYSYYRENRVNLKHYAAMSNYYYQDFERVVSDTDVITYDGIVFMTTHRGMYEANVAIIQQKALINGKIVWLNTDTRWAPNAYKKGFKRVLLCGSTNRRAPLCTALKSALSENGKDVVRVENSTGELHRVVGVYDNHLIVELDPALLAL